MPPRVRRVAARGASDLLFWTPACGGLARDRPRTLEDGALRTNRRIRRSALCLAVVGACLGAAPARAAEDDVPADVRRHIEDLLKVKVAGLLDERNADGEHFRRGTYSRTFR